MVFAAFGCSIKQEATVKSDGSGEVSFQFKMMPFFIDYIVNMSELIEDESVYEDGKIFDVEQIQQDFQTKPSVTLKSITSKDIGELKGSFTFSNVADVFQEEEELAEAGIISFTNTGGVKTLKVHLTRNNFEQLYSLFPIMNNPLFESFGPMENEGVTEEEYLDMLEFAFGEDGPQGVKKSEIELDVKVDGAVVSQTGGKQRGNTVTFSIPLIDILLLQEPLTYSIVFK
jgi:hypothetical protein